LASFIVVPLFLIALAVAEIVRLIGLVSGHMLERWNDQRAWTRTRHATPVPLPPLREGQRRRDS
jgi:hypothetical protein